MLTEIDRKMPLPALRSRYPFDEIKVGESFFAPKLKRSSVWSYLSGMQRKTNKRFACRTLTEDGVEGVRVWRLI